MAKTPRFLRQCSTSTARPREYALSLLQLLLRPQLRTVSALLLPAVAGPRVHASVAPAFGKGEERKERELEPWFRRGFEFIYPEDDPPTLDDGKQEAKCGRLSSLSGQFQPISHLSRGVQRAKLLLPLSYGLVGLGERSGGRAAAKARASTLRPPSTRSQRTPQTRRRRRRRRHNTYFLQISLSWLVFLARICREGSMIPPLRRSTKCKVDSFWML